jgi:nicotinate-nucleotide--dimethylbenzimidazole phosphoribosyltransferase
MTRDEVLAALRIGDQLATRARHDGYPLLVAGEVGIANTTCAAALICALTGSAPEDVVGIGTGISEVQRARKIEVVRDALRLHAAKLTDPIDMMASIGGLELTAMTGFFLAAARERLPVIVDGYLATAAALVAKRIAPRVIDYMRASHASAERGAAIASSALGITPLLDFGLRLGEGTGALLAADLVRTAVELQLSMATFASASVPRRMSLK